MIYCGERNSLTDLEHYTARIVTALEPHIDRFDYLAVSGMSGTVAGAATSVTLGVPLVIVRKDDDTRHHLAFSPSGQIVGRADMGGRYLLLDDFIASGRTAGYIRTVLREETPAFLADFPDASPPVYAGCYMYDEEVLSWDGDDVVTFTEYEVSGRLRAVFDQGLWKSRQRAAA